MARLEQLEKAFNTNTQAFSNGIQMIEAQQEVLRRVARDLAQGAVRVEGMGLVSLTSSMGPYRADLAIDFNGYLKAYIEELAAAEAKAEQEMAADTTPILATPDEEAPIIFGG